MDIKEFVKETLRQIVEGVREVQSEVADKSQIALIGNRREKVEFDIAVTVEEGKKRRGCQFIASRRVQVDKPQRKRALCTE